MTLRGASKKLKLPRWMIFKDEGKRQMTTPQEGRRDPVAESGGRDRQRQAQKAVRRA